ncbi:hypothetical protein M670_01876 [Schinkia azotoformans MEV2011]|uniref:Uncharacterized protein n=1 Tax=Schinkia azotoformans MEV2011 TaxID=1348973 RepID=A0A072NZK8_SCHAZ|nr:hypothetical protein M670_01876 [Schinkia azotoformans MEV2011]
MLKSIEQLSMYSILYNKIPDNHILKLINKAVDFSFINKLLENLILSIMDDVPKIPTHYLTFFITNLLLSTQN